MNYIRYPLSDGDVRIAKEEKLWFESEDHDYIFCFLNLCYYCRVDSGALKVKVNKLGEYIYNNKLTKLQTMDLLTNDINEYLLTVEEG